jgi:CRISPR/Cas system endoribonuclease Cas6 (RAMP superfamily)
VTTRSLAHAAHLSTPTREACRADRALSLYVEHFEEIALSFRAGVYKVPSCTGAASYTVRLVPEAYCSCPDFRSSECKHLLAVRVIRKKTSPCAGCGRRFRFRDLFEVPEGDLTFFEGDRLCRECACSHGAL